MSLTPRQVGEIITAEQFNELITEYQKYWGDNYPASTFTDADNTTHRFGWGIAPVDAPVAIGVLIEANHINKLTRQVNAGLYHIDETSSLIGTYKNVGDVVTAQAYNEIINKLNFIDTNRFGINSIDIDDQGGVILEDNLTGSNPLSWTDYAQVGVKATFTDYTEARHFFNSGGTITFNLDATPGTVIDNYWDYMFNAISEIRFGAIQTANVGGAAHRLLYHVDFIILDQHSNGLIFLHTTDTLLVIKIHSALLQVMHMVDTAAMVVMAVTMQTDYCCYKQEVKAMQTVSILNLD